MRQLVALQWPRPLPNVRIMNMKFVCGNTSASIMKRFKWVYYTRKEERLFKFRGAMRVSLVFLQPLTKCLKCKYFFILPS